MKSVVMVAVAATAVLVVTGCSSNEPDAQSSGDAVVEEGSSSGAGRGQQVSGSHVEALDGSTLSFGEPIELDDGLTVVVSRPKPFEPSAQTVTGADEHVRFTVRLVNRTGKRISPADVSVTVESGGGQGGDVFDNEHAMSGPPTRPVKPGGKASWVHGFGVVDPADVSVVVQAGLERAPVEFSASATE